MTVGSLFAGIGGFDLGFERAGFEIKWQVEIDPFCRKVLEKHWPHVRRYDDVRTVGADLEAVDVLCGGFPCQDISVAGRGVGIDGERSGLWFHFDRLIGELRPSYVVVENVSALLGRGFSRVLGDLATRGFDAEWDCLPASAFGAPHQRDRVWIVAYAQSSEWWPLAAGGHDTNGHDTGREETPSRSESGGEAMAHSSSGGQPTDRWAPRQAGHVDISGEVVSDTDSRRAYEEPQRVSRREGEIHTGRDGSIRQVAYAHGPGCVEQRWAFPTRAELASAECRSWWGTEPNVGRVAHGVPARVDRLRGLGNAIVPQIAEWIARQILAYEESLVA